MLSGVFRKVRQNKLRTAVIIVVGIIAVLGLQDLLLGVHQLSAYDSGWDDLSKFRTSLELNNFKTSSIVSTPLILNRSEGTAAAGRVLVVIGVERPYMPAEIATIVEFVSTGGCLLLADDFGYGNSLALKFDLAFSGRKLFSAAFDRNPAFIKLNGTVDNTLSGPRFSLISDRPTALEKVVDDNVRGWTYRDTWLDENGNGERDLLEASNPYPVVAAVDYIEGAVIVVSDPGLFINDMWGRADNSEFILGLVTKYFSGAHEFIFDETRHKPETLREGAWRTGMLLEVMALDNIYGKVAMVVLSLLALIVGALMVRPPAEWRHEDTLGEVSLYYLAEGKYRAEDRTRLRQSFLEKVRISLNLYPDEFAMLGRDRLREEIDDGPLIGLVEHPQSVRTNELDGLVERARAWRRR